MKPKLVALNLALAAILCATVWKGIAEWNAVQAMRRSTLNPAVKSAAPPPLAPIPQPETPAAMKYEDVAKKNLFSSDRNDDIVLDPPKVVVQPSMPPLPVATGVMKLPSGVKAFMAEKAGDSPRLVQVEDKIGDFKIVALDEQNVTFEWSGKQIERRIDDLIDRSNRTVTGNNPAPPPGPSAPPPPPPANQGHTTPGVDLTPTSKACRPGDTSPSGTVEDGYKKVVTQSIFGPVCRWIKQ